MVNFSLVFLAIVAIAVMVVGLIEWVKGWPLWNDPVKNPKGAKFPGWFPSVASPVFCLALGQLVAPLVLSGLLRMWGVALGLLALAVTELCYQLIVQSVPQVLSGMVSKISSPRAP